MLDRGIRYQPPTTGIACSSVASTQQDVCVAVDNASVPETSQALLYALQPYYPDSDDEFKTVDVLYVITRFEPDLYLRSKYLNPVADGI